MAIAAIGQLKKYLAFRKNLSEVLSNPLRPQDCAAIVEQQLAQRDDNFLARMQHDVYGNSRSPYLPLLRAARIEFADVSDRIRRNGIDAALRDLRDADVYLSFEEYKGRAP